ncbi:MAG: hypothetical protein J0G29_00200, partial [Alphaproteobacteria bacterium]|nr:hypothetical protein [Alphaproteobacteria bacterium]
FDDDQGNNSDTVVIEQIKQLVGQFKVFNFGVDTYHTYFIGDGAYVLVHNPLTIMNSDGSVNRKETDAHRAAFAVILELGDAAKPNLKRYFQGAKGSPLGRVEYGGGTFGKYSSYGLEFAHFPAKGLGAPEVGFLVTNAMAKLEPSTKNPTLAEARRKVMEKGTFEEKMAFFNEEIEGAVDAMEKLGGSKEGEYYRRSARGAFMLHFKKQSEDITAWFKVFDESRGGGGGGGGAAAGGAGCSCK